MKTFHEALASTSVQISFTAHEASRLADLFNRIDSGGQITPADRNALTGIMRRRFAAACERAEAKARKAMRP